MLSNYLKVALRNMLKHKGYSLTNIIGLAVGITCCVMIMLWVKAEVSFDRFHANADNIYRVCQHLVLGGTPIESSSTAAPVAQAMVEQIPEVLKAARVYPDRRVSVSYEDKQFFEENYYFADNSIFEVLSFPLVLGNPESALSAPYSVVLTEEQSRKYFGDENPIGRALRFDGEVDYAITGVMADIPENSHLQFDMLCSYETLYQRHEGGLEYWGQFGHTTYLLLANGTDPAEVRAKGAGIFEARIGEGLRRVGAELDMMLQPLLDIHLHSHFDGDIAVTGDITYVYLFSAIALFILLIACVNFVNLATARSAGRAREIGMRKAFGAARGRLIGQFLGESLLYSLIAMVLAAVLVQLALPIFNTLAERELAIGWSQAAWLVPSLVGLALLVGLVAGCYPALFLSSLQPVRVLKGQLNAGASSSKFRRVLVVGQFTISVILIVGTVTIFGQIDFMKSKRLGFNKEQLLVIPNVREGQPMSLEALKAELNKVPRVVSVSASSNVPGTGFLMTNFRPEGAPDDGYQLLANIDVDAAYVPTLGLEIIEGRNFSADLASDPDQSCLINKETARRFGWDSAIGKTIGRRVLTSEGPATIERTVVGVVRDFHLASLRDKIEPLFIANVPSQFTSLAIRLDAEDIPGAVSALETSWQGLAPDTPFDYFFLDESFNRQYQSEERLGKIALTFCLLAIFVGCLGLLGLSSYTAERRTREIGIRKVLGASVGGIVRLLSQEFLVLVLVANVIGAPVAYYLMDRWLSDFAYHIDIGWTIFALSSLLVLLIALSAVSVQAIRAALADPVAAIKYE